jgi:hypothetical protein
MMTPLSPKHFVTICGAGLFSWHSSKKEKHAPDTFSDPLRCAGPWRAEYEKYLFSEKITITCQLVMPPFPYMPQSLPVEEPLQMIPLE